MVSEADVHLTDGRTHAYDSSADGIASSQGSGSPVAVF